MNQNTVYPIEELVAVVGKITDKYTSKESSSVTYDTAAMLMGAVIYCLEEYRREKEQDIHYTKPSDGRLEAAVIEQIDISLWDAYTQGYQLVLDKVYAAKRLYHRLLKDFEGYHCYNYIDTLQNGMPAFFRHYDAKYKPQDHILTLDYPTLGILKNIQGVDIIYEYLQYIQIESTFLRAFPDIAVENLLRSIQPEYKELFLDNICKVVLERAVWCMIADRPVSDLALEDTDKDIIKDFFELDKYKNKNENKEMLIENIESKISGFIQQLVNHGYGGKSKLKKYLESASRDMAVKIYYL